LTLGSQSAANVTAICAELEEIHRLNPRIRGVLGQNFLSGFNYILDYRNRCIELEEKDKFKEKFVGLRLAVERDRGRMLLAVEPPSRKATFRLVIDSGTGNLVLFGSVAQYFEIDLDQGVDGFTNTPTVIGRRLIQTGRVRRLNIGGERFNDVP